MSFQAPEALDVNLFGMHLSDTEAALGVGAILIGGVFAAYEAILHGLIDTHAGAAKKVKGHVSDLVSG